MYLIMFVMNGHDSELWEIRMDASVMRLQQILLIEQDILPWRIILVQCEAQKSTSITDIRINLWHGTSNP
jgi:hypothetical protein